MMKFNPLPLALLALIAACDSSQPLNFTGLDEGPSEEDEGSIEQILDDATDEVNVSSFRDDRGDLVRTEELDLETGAGFAEDFFLDGTEDTLEIDNLAFDGLNVYTRGANVDTPKLSDLGTIGVYHGDETVPDFLTGNPVPQFVDHVALYNESDVIIPGDEEAGVPDLPRTSFAVVRTGRWTDIPNPGGFIYQRAGGVTIAETGQATFTGDYGGLRIYDLRNRMDVVEGDVTINIDFDDFNALDGVAGTISNRQAYTPDGELLPTTNLDNIFDQDLSVYPAGTTREDLVQLPDVEFKVRISGESIAADGEISGEVENYYVDPNSGQLTEYEQGEYFAIIAGDTTVEDGGEVVGVVRMDAPVPLVPGLTVQETGGFIATR